MPRPCAALHSPDPACEHCRWLGDRSLTGRLLRQAWGEPEPPPLLIAPPALGPPPPGPPPSGPRECVHRGPVTGQSVPCGTCAGGSERPRGSPLPLYHCALHGECTLDLLSTRAHRSCATCPDRAAPVPPAPPPRRSFPVRHCLYHVYPLRASTASWRRCCALLAARAALFTGRRLAAAAVGPDTEPADAVREALPGWEVIEWPNDHRLREAGTLPLLLSRLAEAGAMSDPGAAVFFGHAKGVTRPWNLGVTCHPWSWLLHECLLGYWPLIEASLSAHPITGAFKKVGHGFGGSSSAWHYSGAFFWARAEALAGRRVESHWFGAESSPGTWFAPHEAGCVFHEGQVPGLDLYSMEYLKHVLVEWAWWKREHANDRTVLVPAD